MSLVPRKIQGDHTITSMRFCILVSRFNDVVTKKLVDGALQAFEQFGLTSQALDLAEVPGAFELPLAALSAAKSGSYQAVICLGTIIRGSTPHFDYVANSAAQGILQAGLTTAIPVVFGVLTTNTVEQALERAGGKLGNKGYDAAVTAIDMAQLIRTMAKA